MDSYRIFHPDTHLRTPKSKFWTPNHKGFGFRRFRVSGFRVSPPDLPEAPGVPPGLHAALGMDLGWFGEGHMRSSMVNNSKLELFGT